MERKFAPINLSLVLALLFTIVFQSVHSYRHFLEEATVHATAQGNEAGSAIKIKKLAYSHQKCFACEFTLSSFVAPDIFSFQSLVIFEEAAYSFASKESADFFSGSLLSLRGPPSIC